MILGLPGVGKTVLLNQIKERAISIGYLAEMQEVHDGAQLKRLLIPVLRRLLLRLDRTRNAVETVKKGIRILRSFIGPITISAAGTDVTLPGAVFSGVPGKPVIQGAKAIL